MGDGPLKQQWWWAWKITSTLFESDISQEDYWIPKQTAMNHNFTLFISPVLVDRATSSFRLGSSWIVLNWCKFFPNRFEFFFKMNQIGSSLKSLNLCQTSIKKGYFPTQQASFLCFSGRRQKEWGKLMFDAFSISSITNTINDPNDNNISSFIHSFIRRTKTTAKQCSNLCFFSHSLYSHDFIVSFHYVVVSTLEIKTFDMLSYMNFSLSLNVIMRAAAKNPRNYFIVFFCFFLFFEIYFILLFSIWNIRIDDN